MQRRSSRRRLMRKKNMWYRDKRIWISSGISVIATSAVFAVVLMLSGAGSVAALEEPEVPAAPAVAMQKTEEFVPAETQTDPEIVDEPDSNIVFDDDKPAPANTQKPTVTEDGIPIISDFEESLKTAAGN